MRIYRDVELVESLGYGIPRILRAHVMSICGPICRSVATACYGKDYKHVDGDTSCLSDTTFCTPLKAIRCWGIEAAVLAAEGAETPFADQLVQIL